MENVEKRRGTTWKALKAARKEATEKGLIVGSLRNHCSLLFPSHAQVASVIAKCFRLHSLSAFLSAFDCCRPPPLKNKSENESERREQCMHYHKQQSSPMMMKKFARHLLNGLTFPFDLLLARSMLH